MSESTPESTPLWVTYNEAAVRLNSTPGAVRTRARRELWPKQRPNGHGQPARVQIPESALSGVCPPPEAPTPPRGEDAPRTEGGQDGGQGANTAHIADLRAALERAAAREVADAVTIAFLQGQIERLQQAQLPRRSWWRWRR